MATNPIRDGEIKSSNRHVVQRRGSPKEVGCEFCDNPRCNGNHGQVKPYNDGQLLQTVRNNEDLDWRQYLGKHDDFVRHDFHNRMGQTHQLARDNPQVKGALKNERAHAIGNKVRITYEPDYHALGLSIEWRMEAAAQIEDMWERDMEDPVYCWNDASGQQTFSGQMGLSFMECHASGEALGIFVEDESEKDHRPFSTSLSIIDISRLSSPTKYKNTAQDRVIDGKRKNRHGRTMGYYIADEMPNVGCHNRFSAMEGHRLRGDLKWRYVPRYTDWNSPQVVHWYDKERAGQNRATPDIAAALKRSHMLEVYEETIIDAAIRDASFAMWLESDMPNAAQAFNANPGMSPAEYVEQVMGAHTEARINHHADRELELRAGSGLLAQLMTTERINSITPTSPTDNHVNFGRAMQTAIASSIGVDPYTYTGDMTNVNFSTIRASLIKTWVNRYYKRDNIFSYMGVPFFVVWFEEKIARGEFKFPISSNRTLSHLNYFYNNRRALSMVDFCGPGQEPIDQIKWFRSQDGAISKGLQTRQSFYKQYTKTTFRKATDQLEYEKKVLKEKGLDEFTNEQEMAVADGAIGQAATDRTEDERNREDRGNSGDSSNGGSDGGDNSDGGSGDEDSNNGDG